MNEEDRPPSGSQRVCSSICNSRTSHGDLYWLSLRGGATAKGLAINSPISHPQLRKYEGMDLVL